MLEHQVPRVVYISESELTTLINESTRANVVHARFGGGRVWLDDEPHNQWAFKRLTQLRGIDLVYDY